NTKQPTEKPISSDPHNFRNLNIFPSKDDLLDISNVKIVPHIVNGAYPSLEHYLDLQFKLLREDCFGPLREGINKYLANPLKRKYENIRVYPKVRVIRAYVSNNKVGHLVDIAWGERASNISVDYRKCAHNKRLMHGSLVLFTCDSFQNILCASVLDSSLDLLRSGCIAVSFQNPISSSVYSEKFLMVESEVFFEPYHRVLKVLQEYHDVIPMKKYIIDVQPESKPPAYLTGNTTYTIRDHESREITFPVVNTDQWPTPEAFGLDQSQLNAFKFALTREFAVIQGPPGTGKTFLGVKIASTLLNNLSFQNNPMLIICYTNHALDQFLEAILGITKNVVRLGSQSKSKLLEPYNINNVRLKTKSKYSYLFSKKRTEIEVIFKKMTDLQTVIEKCEREVLCYKTIKKHLKIGDVLHELDACDEDAVLDWLFEANNSKERTDDWEKFLEYDDGIETCFSEEYALKQISTMNDSMKCLIENTDQIKGDNAIEKFQKLITKMKNRLETFKNYMVCAGLYQNLDVPSVNDLYELGQDDRWKLYFKAVEGVKRELTEKMNRLITEHNACSEELSEVSNLIDEEVLGCARVVGITTSGAASRHRLMDKLGCSVVIVEEAAEVLEAHIVASLTHKCEHLILIGDHKQLRPSTAHYVLAKKYNLEISLFERMIRNRIHSITLTTQRRMRSNFVELLVPVIYDKLDSFNVDYPKVKGMKDNLYFYNHSAWEDTEGLEDSWSHKNSFEAKWCVSLANYLKLMKYDSADITILTTYTGQVTLIKEMASKYHLLSNVKVVVVDNYQGEESRIVILSLVRSNRDGDIGFLNARNRICVALSRAKEGFYIFGNMNVLEKASPTWRQIHEKLKIQKAIGNKITVMCDIHGKTLDIRSTADMDNCLDVFCLRNCRE
ncbi:NFX1-type zinc finger-containing protein 1, partial [Danaus plexippus plexippus]